MTHRSYDLNVLDLSSQNPTLLMRIRRVLPGMVLIAGLSLTAFTVFLVLQTEKLRAKHRFDDLTVRIESKLNERFRIFLSALLQTRGLFQVNAELTRSVFSIYADNINLPVLYPGILALGYAKRLGPSPREQADLEKLIIADYTIPEISLRKVPNSNESEASEKYPIRLLEPQNSTINRRVLGMDLFSEEKRRATIEIARDANKPILSPLIRIAYADRSQIGYLLVLPVYKHGANLENIESRRRNIVGVVFSAFLAENLFRGIFGNGFTDEGINFRIYDETRATSRPIEASGSDNPYIFDYLGQPSDNENSAEHVATIKVSFGSHPFSVRVFSLKRFDSASALWVPFIISGLGIMLSFIAYRMTALNIIGREKLAKSENQLRLITDSLPVLICYIDMNFRVRFVNQAYQKWFSTEKHEALHCRVEDALGEANFSQLSPFLQHSITGLSLNSEGEWRLADGTRHPVSVHYAPDHDPQGAVRGVVVLVTDVSEQKHLEANQRLLSDLSAILGSSLDIDTTFKRVASLLCPSLADFCTIDLVTEEPGEFKRFAAARSKISLEPRKVKASVDNGEFSVTPTFGPRFAYASGEMQLTVHMTPEQLNEIAIDGDEANELNKLKSPHAAFVPLRTRERTLGVLSLYVSSVDSTFASPDLMLILEIARRSAFAIENARLYREAQLANRAKDEFLATISHELRTPMNVILGWLEILASEDLDSETYEMALSTLTRNARAQIQLINDLLDISRIISGKLSINPQPAELASLVQIGIDSIRPAARAKDIEIVVDLPKLPVQLSIDSDRMQQVLWNLLANAVKFTPEHGRIDIVMEDRGHQVRFLIKDTGQGIDARFLPFVFDRFRQEDGSTTRSQGGLGLGLAIARYLVELHGGAIDVHSEGRGKGTEFTVSLPRRSVTHVSTAAQEGSTVPRADENQGLSGDLKNVKILLIDDSPDVRTLVSRILTRAGALVTAVDSAASGFEEFEKSRPDVVLSDIGLPHEDGTSLIRRLRQLEAEAQTARVPAAALTAYAQESDTHKFLVAGFDSHIPKPVSAMALLQCVHSLLDPTLAKRA